MQNRQTLRKSGSTFDEMISTGSIELIRDPTLRDTAVRLYKLTVFDNLVNEGMRVLAARALRSWVLRGDGAQVLHDDPIVAGQVEDAGFKISDA